MAAIKETNGDRIFNAFCVTLATILMLIVIYPLIYIVSCSFSDPELVATGKVWLFPVGLNVEGYIRVFQDKNIMTGYANTVLYTLGGTLINLALTLPGGYALSKKTMPGRTLIVTYLFITMYFSGGLIPSYLLVKSLGLLDSRLLMFIISAVSIYNLLIARTFFQAMPAEIEEAATIDGASTLRVFLQIILPLSKALIGVMVLYYGVAHWNSYFAAMIYLRTEAKMPLQIFLRKILILEDLAANMAAQGDDERILHAERLKMLLKYSVILVSSLPVLVIYPFLQKYFDKGVMLGSIKG